MSLPVSTEDVTKLFLYGSTTVPADLTDESLLNHSAPSPLQFQILDFMTNGPGRFAKGSQSGLINQFFDEPLNVC